MAGLGTRRELASGRKGWQDIKGQSLEPKINSTGTRNKPGL